MADPFELLGSISGAPPPPPPQQQQQHQGVPQPGWPGMSNPSDGAASFGQQHQYPSSVGNSSRFAGFHPQQNIVGRANSSAAAAPQPLQPFPGASAGYAMYPAGPYQQQYQQQQQQQHVATAAPAATSWSTGTPASSSGMFQPAAASTQDLAPGTGPTAAAVAATTKPIQLINTSAGGMGVVGDASRAGAEWTPPADQMGSYHDMWTTASAGCPAPGTVSGRAAVQFFSRSGLPKDALKTIWSLCDPSLSGCIRQPGFFAAMRLISITQQQGRGPPSSSPPAPSLSALEATRFASLPVPRMEGFPPPSPASAVRGDGSGGTHGVPSVPPATTTTVAAGAPAPPSSMTSPTAPSLDVFPAMPVVGGGGEGPGRAGGVAAVGSAAASIAQGGVEFPPPSLSAGPAGSPPASRSEIAQPQPQLFGTATVALPATAGGAATAVVGVGPAVANDDREEEDEEEDDDFGDFAGAQEMAQPSAPPPTDEDEGDDFGEFAGAATSVPAAAAASTAPGAGGEAATGGDSGGGGSGDDVAWMREDDDSWGASNAPGGLVAGKGGGLDDLIKSNLHATTAGPLHLADMQSTPPLLGKAPNPVMVDRASVTRSKLSVFDEMADLDLAVGQEDWNDFADETTAPPRSPTPPPLPSSPPPLSSSSPPLPSSPPPGAAAPVEGTGDAVPAVAAVAIATGASDGATETNEAPRPPTLPRNPGLGIDDFGGGGSGGGGGGGGTTTSSLTMAMGGQQEPLPFSPFDGVEVAPAVPGAESTGPAQAPEEPAQGQDDDDWGDFEDASGRKESSDGAMAAGGRDGTAAPGEGDDEDEEWGTFTDAPPPPAEAVVAEGGINSGDGLKLAPPAAGDMTGSDDSDDLQAVPQDTVDPFAEIAPSTPPQPSSVAYGIAEAVSPGGNEEATAAGQGGFGRSRGASMTAEGLPLSLRGLRDALARRGRLEEAVEVQRRMELPSASSTRPPQAQDNAAGDGIAPAEAPGSTLGTDAADETETSGGDEKDRDLERWRAAVELPAAQTVDELAETMTASDDGRARADEFRARFVDGRLPVEEAALAAGGGAAALAEALRRQRAARRAVYLSSVLGAGGSESKATTAGDVLVGSGRELDGSGAPGEQQGEAELELEVGFGLDAKGARPPPTLSDWGLMTAYVTRMAEEGLAVLLDGGGAGGGGGDHATGAETTTPPQPSSTPPLPPPPMSSLSDAAAGGSLVADAATAASSPPSCSAAGGTGAAMSAAVGGEVARSEKFQAFARGLREAVRVCRMTQAAAEDACCPEGEGVAGFAGMEKAWAELRRNAREAIGDNGDGLCSVFGEEEGDGTQRVKGAGEGLGPTSGAEFRPFSSGKESDDVPIGRTGGSRGRSSRGGGSAGSVAAVREACVGHAPADSALCAVSLQPLSVFGGDGGSWSGGDKSSTPPGVVEYCGVRYLARAVNLWVNVLDKPPPGPLP
eukprot:g5685.t1